MKKVFMSVVWTGFFAFLLLGLLSCTAAPSPLSPTGTNGTTSIPATNTVPVSWLSPRFSNVLCTPGLTYGYNTNLVTGVGENLTLDFFEPDGDTSTSRPAIVWVHGGGFSANDSGEPNMTNLCTQMARRGYVTASLNYRKVTESWKSNANTNLGTNQTTRILAAMVGEDVKAAIRWMRSVAGTRRIDPEHIAVGGGSAGAIGSLWAAYSNAEGNSGNPGFRSTVQTVIDFWGAMDPVTTLTASGAPLLVIHGTADATVPYAYGVAISNQCVAVGLPFEFHALPGAPHGYWTPINTDYVPWVAAFLQSNMMSR